MSCTHGLMHTSPSSKGAHRGLCVCALPKSPQITPYAATSFKVFSVYQTWSFRVAFKVDVDNWNFRYTWKTRWLLIKFDFLHRNSHSDYFVRWILFNLTFVFLLLVHLVGEFFEVCSPHCDMLVRPLAGTEGWPSLSQCENNISPLITSVSWRIKLFLVKKDWWDRASSICHLIMCWIWGEHFTFSTRKEWSYKTRWIYIFPKRQLSVTKYI